MPASSTTNIPGGTMTASSRHTETAMRALFVGGTVDNSELDIDGNEPPLNYPPSTGSGQPRYRLHHVGKQGGSAVYAVYGAPDLADAEVRRISEERGYARRFGDGRVDRSEEHQSDLPSLMRISYAGFCVTKKK